MNDLKIVTDRVHPDEGCYGLYEGPRDGRWLTALYVVRGDAIAEYTVDHGPEEAFAKIPPMMMPSYGENSVGEMLDWGERHRHDLRWFHKIERMKAESTLIQDVIEQRAERHLRIHNRSTFGPYQTIERNGHSRTATWRRFKDKIAERTGKRVFA